MVKKPKNNNHTDLKRMVSKIIRFHLSLEHFFF